ncbi:hypothetical protein HMPREF9004_0246 [Schaalia cardiffensis F0333]|uniref:Uncharacterized protein n=1 Tax=Schaalia cardiffensis F0333 TaxID=888050 RepID=N6X594_9ACTO|nr:hypothetical protein HMPREF9004_0246 [Schaalia cardiffensis F0333]
MVSQGLDIVFAPRVVNALSRGNAPRGARARPCACAPSAKVWNESPSAELTAIL